MALTLATALVPLTQDLAGASGDQSSFSGPEGMVLAGAHLWVTDSGSNAITEINASNGSSGETIQSRTDRFDVPVDITTGDGYIWVVNTGSHSITQLNSSDGSLVRVIESPKYQFYSPSAITYGDAHLWITSDGSSTHNPSLIELNPTNGALVRVIHSKGLYSPFGITIHGQDVWVTNQQNNSVAEFNAANGSLIRVINASSYRFDEPYGIQSAKNDLWVSNGKGEYPMTEINASTGSLVRVIKATKLWSNNPSDVSTGTGPWNFDIDGATVWIANGANLVEISATSGALIRVVSDEADNFDFTQNVIADGTHVWASSFGSNSVAELNAANGDLERLIP
jgi:hypothetical protein